MSFPLYGYDRGASTIARLDPDTGATVWSVDQPFVQVWHAVVTYDGRLWTLGRETAGGASEAARFSVDGAVEARFTIGSASLGTGWPAGDDIILAEGNHLKRYDDQGLLVGSTAVAVQSASYIEGTKDVIWASGQRYADRLDYDLNIQASINAFSGAYFVHVDDEGCIYLSESFNNDSARYDLQGTQLWKVFHDGNTLPGNATSTATRYLIEAGPRVHLVDRATGSGLTTTSSLDQSISRITTHPNGAPYLITSAGTLYRLDPDTGGTVFSATGTGLNHIATVPSDATDGPSLDMAAPSVEAITPDTITWTWQPIN